MVTANVRFSSCTTGLPPCQSGFQERNGATDTPTMITPAFSTHGVDGHLVAVEAEHIVVKNTVGAELYGMVMRHN